MAASNPPTHDTPALANDLTAGPVGLHLTKLSTYLLIGFIANNASYLMDVVYLGALGIDALAAIAFAFPATYALHAITRGFATGAASVMARALGSGDRERVAVVASHCFVIALLFCMVCAAGYALVAKLFALMGAHGDALALTVRYMLIWLIAFPALAITTVGTLMLRAIGQAPVAGLLTTGGALLQVFVAPFMIFGWLGMPALGIEGAAWAVLVGRGVSAILCVYFYARERLLVVSFREFPSSCASILHIGIPASANNLIVPLSAGVITRLLADYGPAVVAGFGVASRLEVFISMPAMAVASSVGPLVGQNWGAGNFSRVSETMGIADRFCLAWGLLALVAMLLAAEPMVSLINDDPTVIGTASAYLLIVSFTFGFLAMQNSASFSFNALGRPLPPLILAVSRLLVVYVPLAILAGNLYGAIGIFWVTALVNVAAGIAAAAWNRNTIRVAAERGRVGIGH